TVLAGKIASDPKAVEDLLTGPNGLAAALNTLAKKYTATNGALVLRQTSLNDSLKGYDKQIAEVNARASKLEERLRRQFSALDELMATYSSTTSALSSLTTTTGR